MVSQLAGCLKLLQAHSAQAIPKVQWLEGTISFHTMHVSPPSHFAGRRALCPSSPGFSSRPVIAIAAGDMRAKALYANSAM